LSTIFQLILDNCGSLNPKLISISLYQVIYLSFKILEKLEIMLISIKFS